MGEIKFACTEIMINSEIVAKVTSFRRSLSIDEEDITGAEDAMAGCEILHKEFAAVAIDETASIEGIAISADTGQSELADAAEAGETVTLTHTKPDGTGWVMSGYFTSYEETGSTSSIYRFSADFRVNSKEAVSGS